jgi:Fe-S-cluster-containing dehydrogenase component/formate-dependent nitrite reductase membrane component NrfD
MRYGFVIDQDRCIGCHACTVACKEEHQVPLGVFRTWVKYIEKGEFPHTSRHFGVMRCNHCDSAPCITSCPTHALYRRSDGIVDFDNRRCIGCKSCMQACPYDALYIDPNTNTAAKCNFCAHRVEASLEPACVIVCPTQAIIAGDLDDPASKASRMVATEKVVVRKPQKGTQPKLYYKGIDGDLLEPTRLSRQNTYAFAEQRDDRPAQKVFDSAATREVYDVAHPAPWGWKISTYLWTKSIAAGVMLVAAVTANVGAIPGSEMVWGFADLNVVAPVIALIALAFTLALLVFDLKRPDRFFYLLTKPNFRSWLVLGGYILAGYGAAVTAWLLCAVFLLKVASVLKLATCILALAAAGYSAFLFAQAKGRDLWQSSLFFLHLLVQAMVAGTVVIFFVSLFRAAVDWSFVMPWNLSRDLKVWLILNLSMILSEVVFPHVTEDGRRAAQTLMRGGRWWSRFWLALALGNILPILMLSGPQDYHSLATLGVLAAFFAVAGLWFWDDVWVKAGQSVPLS